MKKRSIQKNGKGDRNRTSNHKSYWISPYWDGVERKKKKEPK